MAGGPDRRPATQQPRPRRPGLHSRPPEQHSEAFPLFGTQRRGAVDQLADVALEGVLRLVLGKDSPRLGGSSLPWGRLPDDAVLDTLDDQQRAPSTR